MRIVVSGGGTGGHIYPALALIEQLKARNLADEVLYVGTSRGLESKIVPQAGIPFKTLELQGFKRKLTLENFKTIRLFLKSVREAKTMLRNFKPDVVLGTGGYVSGAIVYAAAKLHIPTVIHEQNSVAGVTNRFLSRYVDKIVIAFPEVASAFPQQKVVLAGNPRAQQVANLVPNDRLAEFGLDPKKRTLLIFGGSRGAPKMNQAAVSAFPAFEGQDFQVLFVTGRIHYQQLADQVTVPANVKMVPYVDDMPAILPDISLIIGRAGATSIAEITALGIPAVLIPSPNVTGNHQLINAQSLVRGGAAELIEETKIDASFGQRIVTLMNSEQKLNAMSAAAKELGTPDAADQLIQVLESVMK